VPVHIDEPGGAVRGDLIVDPSAGLERSEDATVIAQLCAKLGPRDREIIRLRFAEGLLQREIAERVGCSQMQVSRRLRAALRRLQVVATGS
jgi:RNA polymerase sigma-B factor